MDKERIQIGDIVKFYKIEDCTKEEIEQNKHIYKVLNFAEYMDSAQSKVVVYQALYPPFNVYVKDYDMFMSKPFVRTKRKQEYNFEPITDYREISLITTTYNNLLLSTLI